MEAKAESPKLPSRRSMWLARVSNTAIGDTKPRDFLVQAVAFCVVIAAVWGLVAAVEVIYHLPQDLNSSENGEMPLTSNETMNGSSCIRELYRGQICRQALLARQSCLDNSSTGNSIGQVYIPARGDQDALEQTVSQLLDGLQTLPADTQCQLTLLLPFLCSAMFGLCDINGEPYVPPSRECIAVTEFISQPELLLALASVSSSTGLQLPRCQSLPDTSQDCSAFGTGVTNGTTGIPDCSSGFYVGGCPGLPVCRAECGEWEEFPHGSRVALDVFVVLAAVVYIISTVALVVLSAIRYKRMFTFPSVFIVYSPLPVAVFELLLLIGYFDRKKLFCTSIDLEESVANPTAFCTLQGAVFYYCILQQVFIWFFHVVVMFWGIKFPFSSRRFRKKGYAKYLHFSLVLLSFVLPVVTLVVGFETGGYSMPRFPPTTCLAVNLDATFYSFILPITVIMALGISLVACMFCLLCSLNRSMAPYNWQTEINLTDRITKPSTKVTAEIKLLIIFSYFFVFLAVSQTAFAFALRNTPSFAAELAEYFFCEAAGISGLTCERSFERIAGDIPVAIGFVLYGLYPVVTLIYVVNVEELKEFCCARKASSGAHRSAAYSSSSSASLKVTVVTDNCDSRANSLGPEELSRL